MKDLFSTGKIQENHLEECDLDSLISVENTPTMEERGITHSSNTENRSSRIELLNYNNPRKQMARFPRKTSSSKEDDKSQSSDFIN